VRKSSKVETKYVQASNSPAPAAPTNTASQPANNSTEKDAPASPAAIEKDNESKYLTVKSPMIGTFYRSSNPESEPFVKIGDKIKAGQTVCIVEAMKLFNEIESEISGTVVKILLDNASPVEYDQPLFLVDPS